MSNKSRVTKLILILILVVLLLVLVLQNLNLVTIHLFFWKIENLPMIAIILITIVLGYLLGLLTHPFIFKKKGGQGELDKKGVKNKQVAKE